MTFWPLFRTLWFGLKLSGSRIEFVREDLSMVGKERSHVTCSPSRCRRSLGHRAGLAARRPGCFPPRSPGTRCTGPGPPPRMSAARPDVSCNNTQIWEFSCNKHFLKKLFLFKRIFTCRLGGAPLPPWRASWRTSPWTPASWWAQWTPASPGAAAGPG